MSTQDQGIVVFRVWKSLAYSRRISLSAALILAGFVMQYLMSSFFPGGALIIFGNLLLIVKGYDNRVTAKKYSPTASWEKVDKYKFSEVERLQKDMKKWDRSALDISNPLGFFTLAVIGGGIGFACFKGFMDFDPLLQTLGFDAALLFIPHWLTGIRSTLTKPNLVLKIKKIKKLLTNSSTFLKAHDVDYYMLLSGEDAKMPEDVKIRINIKDHHADFLGLYGQIVTNDVSGTAYPYFYVVLVAKKGFGLKKAYNAYAPPEKITKEIKTEGEVEVFVIRQTTTKTSGYHTKDRKMESILRTGVKLAEQAAVKTA
jgi:hypothetical protein